MAAFLHLIVWLTWAFIILAAGKDTSPLIHDYARRTNDRSITQDIVTWDQYSIKVHGERVVFLSGEVHPFRLPSPDLWFDVFQKIRALGFTGVSFYVMWGLLEGEPGTIRTDGVFALEQFFEAANKAGIYLLARPGPYINAEVSGGGFPGWVQRSSGALRTSEPGFLNQISTYLLAVGEIISKAQITKGGPVILVQPENEYTYCSNFTSAEDVSACLDDDYMASVQSQLRHSGVDVPFINNDAFMVGNYAPGTGAGAVDIYGFDDYPFEWSSGCTFDVPTPRIHHADCVGRLQPYKLDPRKVSSSALQLHKAKINQQQGTFCDFGVPRRSDRSLVWIDWREPASDKLTDNRGGYGVEACAAMVNHEFARVFYKLLYGMRVTVLNFYMVYTLLRPGCALLMTSE
jgi:beta-galactosidase